MALRSYAVGAAFSVRDVPDSWRFQRDGTYRRPKPATPFRRRAGAATGPRTGRICPGCGIERPLVGDCGTCW